MTQEQNTLTTAQKKEAITMFRTGMKYGEIAEKLNVQYGLVNKHMTAWKRSQGIIPKTSTKVVTEVVTSSLTSEEREELNFLRRFYAKAITQQLQ